MKTEVRVSHKFIDDDREDLVFVINGVKLVVMPQEGYRSLGLSYEQAQELIKALAQLFQTFAEGIKSQ